MLDMYGKIMLYFGRNTNNTFQTNIFAYLGIHNNNDTALWMERISDMICQIHQIHLKYVT